MNKGAPTRGPLTLPDPLMRATLQAVPIFHIEVDLCVSLPQLLLAGAYAILRPRSPCDYLTGDLHGHPHVHEARQKVGVSIEALIDFSEIFHSA